jgi:hypothetical protein
MVEAKSKGFKRINARDLAENVGTTWMVCYSKLKYNRKKGIVRCDGAIKPKTEWSITNKGCELLAIVASTSDKPSCTKIVHEREHLGIITTKDTLTITGDSVPKCVATDAGTSVNLKTPRAGVDIASEDKKKIEFEEK